MPFSLLDVKMNGTCDGVYFTCLNYLVLLHYLVKIETPKMQTNRNSYSNINYKTAIKCINLLSTDSFIICDKSYKWTSEHAFKVSATRTHTWSQMVMPHTAASIMSSSKSNRICVKRFCRSSMSWIFVLYTHCCTIPQITKYKAHDHGAFQQSYDKSGATVFGNIPL